MDFVGCVKEKFATIQDNLAKGNFRACENISTDIIRASEFTGFREGIYLGEFFESAFSNVNALNNAFEVEKEHIEGIKKDMFPAIDFVQKNIPFNSVPDKAKLLDALMQARCTVTSVQVKYFRERKPKRATSMPFPVPMAAPVAMLEEE